MFYFVKNENQYEDICNDITMYQINVIEHGGSIEEYYTPQVTHLICASQKNSIVLQVIYIMLKILCKY